MQNITSPLAILAPIAATAQTGARFASFDYTAKGTGERARHTLALGVSVENAYKRDIAILNGKRSAIVRQMNNGADTVTLNGKPFTASVALQAADEKLASLRESLTVGIGNNAAYTCRDTYAHIATGIRAHKQTGEVYVHGFTLGKVVLTEGTYKKVNSSEKTLAKKALEHGMKSARFRNFSITELHGAKMNGAHLIFE